MGFQGYEMGLEYGTLGLQKSRDYGSLGGEYIIKGLEMVLPWVVYILSWMKLLAPLVIIGYIAYRIYLVSKDYWVEGNPNEYTILCRDGHCIKQGIGLSTWIMPGDKIVTFPSQLC